jgi:hypothetical protein
MSSLAFRTLLDRKWMHVAVANALPQGSLQIGRPAMLLQEVAKRFLGKRLEFYTAIQRKQRNGLPCLVVELNAFARHGQNQFRKRSSALQLAA